VKTLQSYLLRQFLTSFLAVAAVLFMLTLGGLFADLIREIASGKVPVGLLLSQLGLRSTRFFQTVLPLALFLGLILSISRLYAENEMSVIASVGVAPKDLLKPIAWVVIPVVIVIALFSTWLMPWANRAAQQSVETANRSFLLAGLEQGRFIELPGNTGVLYVSEMTSDGGILGDIFLYNERDNRVDVVTAQRGRLVVREDQSRKLELEDGFRVEGEPGKKDFRMLRYERNLIEVPEQENNKKKNVFANQTLWNLIASSDLRAKAEMHLRFGTPLLALALAFWALPLARSPPRQQRYGRMLYALLLYVLGMNLLVIGSDMIADGKIPAIAGLWWIHLPLFAFVAWQVGRDGRLPARSRQQ
jgi:lipopolysaccharide export system permease protein